MRGWIKGGGGVKKKIFGSKSHAQLSEHTRRFF
nr:MAG TPA: hypothetical protein [Caudoviricetes sp.]